MVSPAKAVSLAALLLAAQCYSSASTTYNYIGRGLTSVSGSWVAGGRPAAITLSMTFSSPLAPNLNWVAVPFPSTWSMSDGLRSFNQSSPGCVLCQGPVTVSTDANGQIVYWAFRIAYTITINSTAYTEDMQTAYFPPGIAGAGAVVAEYSQEYYFPGGTLTVDGTAQNNTSVNANAMPGFWRSSASSSFPPIRVNCGSAVNYVDPAGQLWAFDTGFTGGSVFSTSSPIGNTNDAPLYQTERFSASGNLQYQFGAPAGAYNVRLKFAEVYFTSAGQRTFNIQINGSTVKSGFDILATAGAANTAVDLLFPVTSTGIITVTLVPVVSLPKISAIEITQNAVQVAVQPAVNKKVSVGGGQQFTATVVGNANIGVTWSTSGPGSIDQTGLYTVSGPIFLIAPLKVTITATSNADNTAVATATVLLVPCCGSEDVGTPMPAGSDSYANGAYTVSGAGDIAGTSDSYHYVYQFMTGDGAITARINATGCCVLPSKAGLLMRDSGPLANSWQVFMGIYSNIVALLETRASFGGATVVAFGGAGVSWVKLVRTGNTFSGFASTDGNAWLPVGTPVTIPMGSSIQVGYAVASSFGPLYTASFDNVEWPGLSISVDQRLSAVAPGGSATFTATTVGGAQGATWSISPAGLGSINAATGQYTAPAVVTNPAQQSVTITATSTADPTKSDSVVALLSSTLAQPLRVNSGGPFTIDPNGVAWSADTGSTVGNVYSTGATITNTTTPFLYATERFNTANLVYSYYLPNGNYSVKLKFAEIFFTTANQRSMNIRINGTIVQSNFDPFTAAGGANKAIDVTFPVTVSAGTITISLEPANAGVSPKISAIEIM